MGILHVAQSGLSSVSVLNVELDQPALLSWPDQPSPAQQYGRGRRYETSSRRPLGLPEVIAEYH